MKHKLHCAVLLVALLVMMLIPAAHAAEATAPPPHSPPPASTEAPHKDPPEEETTKVPHKDPPEQETTEPPPHGEPPTPEGEYNPIIPLYLDANGGTFRNGLGMNLYDAEMPAEPGDTLASMGYTIDTITCAGKTFQGWIAYDAAGNTPISGLLTTAQVLNYTLPNHPIRFEIQWKALEAAPITAITYAAFFNGTGTVDSDTRVTLVANGIRYSGNGSVTISKDIYSQWTGNVKVIWECPGKYISANNRWIPDYFESEGPVKSFIKEGSCYISISRTGKETDTPSPRDLVNDYFYSVRNVAPVISREEVPSADTGISLSSGAPEVHTLSAEQLQSGSVYTASMTAMKKATQTDNVLIFDITARDAAGNDLHQLKDTAEVKVPLPKDYVIQSGNTVQVYYLPGDGAAVPCSTVLHDEDPANRYLIFRTDHFSLYAVAEVAKAPADPSASPTPSEPEVSAEPETPVEIAPSSSPESSSAPEVPSLGTSASPGTTPAPEEPEIPAEKEPSSLPESSAPPEAPAAADTSAAGLLVPVIAVLAVVIIAAVIFLLKKRSG